MSKKIKAILLCHFSNEEVRAQLPVSFSGFEAVVRRLLRRNSKATKYNDFAPWITNLICEFEKIEDLELHVVAPAPNLSGKTVEFDIKGVHYHFFKGNLSFPFEQLAAKIFGAKRRFNRNTRLVQELVKKINPDIVNLVGSENPYYSATVLGINHVPVYVSAQTVYTNPDRMRLSGHVSKLNWDIELKIHEKETYFGCSGRMHRDLILRNNPNAIIFKNFFPIQRPYAVKQEKKIYDFVSFSVSISAKKGADDAIEALYFVKKKYPEVMLNLIGHFNKISDYGKNLLKRIDELGLTKNIVFTPYFTRHEDMHQQTQKSRFALLPVKLDVISGSIIEAILLDLPVVCYKTTGTPYLNSENPSVLIAELNNVRELANHMLTLMESEILAQSLAKNAREFVLKTFDNTTSAKRLLADYYAVLAHYHHGTPIPKELLFDTNEFPIY